MKDNGAHSFTEGSEVPSERTEVVTPEMERLLEIWLAIDPDSSEKPHLERLMKLGFTYQKEAAIGQFVISRSADKVHVVGLAEELATEALASYMALHRVLSDENIKLREALTSLATNPHLQLGDLVYDVRESEGLGWEGPSVVAWGEAVVKVQELLKQK